MLSKYLNESCFKYYNPKTAICYFNSLRCVFYATSEEQKQGLWCEYKVVFLKSVPITLMHVRLGKTKTAYVHNFIKSFPLLQKQYLSWILIR